MPKISFKELIEIRKQESKIRRSPRDTEDLLEEHDKLSYQEFFNILKWTTSIQFSISKLHATVYVVTRIITYLSTIINTYIMAKMIDRIVEVVQKSGNLDSIYPYLAILFAYNVLNTVISAFRNYSRSTLRMMTSPRVKKLLYEKMVSLGVQTLEDPSVTNRISRAENSVYNLNWFFIESTDLISTFISFVVSLVLISVNFPVLVPIVIFLAVPGVLYDKKYRTLAWDFGYRNTESSRQAWSSANNLTNPNSLPEVILLRAVKFLNDKFANFFEWDIAQRKEINKRWIFGSNAFYFLSYLGIYFGYIRVLGALLENILTVGDVLFNIRLIDRLSSDFDSFTSTLNNQYESAIRFKDSYALFNLEPAVPDGNTKLEKMTKGPKIEIRNLSFIYPKAKKEVIKDISLEVAPGEKLAIVGHNGAGKTTLMKLISRIYLPSAGDILINDISISDIKADTLRENMSVLFQDYNTYSHLTVRDNVAIGQGSSSKVDDGKVIKMLKMADAWGFVKEYENGLDQILSVRYKGGIRPSTGQWQKLAIARFFYRNAPLVIFDEPTAAIDAVSEYNIFNKIYKFFEHKTVIIISHRFSTVRNADRILVMENGTIIEQGTHKELMAQDGYYAQSFRLQAEGYSNEPVESIA